MGGLGGKVGNAREECEENESKGKGAYSSS